MKPVYQLQMLYFYLLVYANQSTDMTKYLNIIEHSFTNEYIWFTNWNI